MPNDIKRLCVKFISLVDEPANEGSRVVLLKRRNKKDEGGAIDALSAILKRLSPDDVKKVLADALGAAKVGGKEGDDPMKDRIDALAKRIGKLTGDAAKGLQTKLDAVSKAEQKDAEAQLPAIETEVASVEKDGRIAALEAQVAELSKRGAAGEEVKKFRTTLSAPLQKMFDELPAADQAEFMAGYAGTRKAADPVAKALESVTKANTELAQKVAKMEAEKELAAVTAELQKDLGGVVNVAETAEAIVAMRKHAPEAAEALLTQLKAAAARAKASKVFSIVGKDGQDTGSPLAKLEKLAKARAASKGETYAVAYEEVSKENPELFAESVAMGKEPQAAV